MSPPPPPADENEFGVRTARRSAALDRTLKCIQSIGKPTPAATTTTTTTAIGALVAPARAHGITSTASPVETSRKRKRNGETGDPTAPLPKRHTATTAAILRLAAAPPPPLAAVATETVQASLLVPPRLTPTYSSDEKRTTALRVELAGERRHRMALARAKADTEQDLACARADLEALRIAHAAELTVERASARAEVDAQWRELLDSAIAATTDHARSAMTVAATRAADARREAELWRRRAQAAEGMVKWYERVHGSPLLAAGSEEDGDDSAPPPPPPPSIPEGTHRRQTWGGPMAAPARTDTI
ncbi:hypothetical protein BC828DRAFT_439774 [Blastocladiella britannica]|nr:hypothetical protein BC828DRAFT_439774 [Blastocladiella britannica]